MTEHIALTGVGVISPAGTGTGPLFDAMLAGHSFLRDVTTSPTGGSELPWAVAPLAEAHVDWPSGMPWDKNRKYANAAARLAVAAALQAVASASPPSGEQAYRCGTVMAVSSSGADELSGIMPRLATMSQTDPRPLAKLLYDEVPDYTYIRGIPSQLGQFVSMANGFRGSNVAVYGEVGANGLGALALAMRLIDSGELDRVMVVGVGTLPSVTSLVVLDREDALARAARPGTGPFDAGRAGVFVGQSGLALVVEREDVARSRGVVPLAALRACETVVAPTRGAAMADAVRSVLAGVDRAPGLWWAHASGSPSLDAEEWNAVRHHVTAPVTSSKGTIGNPIECGGLIDVALAVEAMTRKTAPPIGLLAEPDSLFADADLVFRSPRRLDALDCVLVTSLNHGSATVAGAAVVTTPTPTG